MIYRRTHFANTDGLYGPYIPNDSLFCLSYIAALRALVKIKNDAIARGYTVERVSLHVDPISTVTGFTFLGTWLFEKNINRYYEYVILKCPISDNSINLKI